MNGGWLTGKYRDAAPVAADSRLQRRYGRLAEFELRRPPNRAKLARLAALHDAARAAGVSLPQLALRWVIGRRGIVAALVGSRTREQLVELPSGLDDGLSERTRSTVNAICPPEATIDPADTGRHHGRRLSI
ncbi:MAG: aldo/keto reductase [Egibacteraceae bacterium]